jgi:hypothetical protein
MKTVDLTCSKCNCIFTKQLKEYNRQIKKGNVQYFYCSVLCATAHSSLKKTKNTYIERECLFCKTPFASTTHKRYKKCCSNDCARKYSQTFVDTKKISSSLKIYNSNKIKCFKPRVKSNRRLITSTCKICNIEFNPSLAKIRQTCSDICFRKLISINSTKNTNCGGETNYKKFKYKDVWMDSSWEVTIAEWLDFNKIEWKRDRKLNFLWTDLNGNKRRYYPDFYLPDLNVYLDPKNKYKLNQDLFKLNQVIKENKINLIFGSVDQIKTNLNSIINKT